jgi:23S rRNA (uracil1939-C5)-methyltransferase
VSALPGANCFFMVECVGLKGECKDVMKVGDEHVLSIVDVALPSGYGVARIEGMVVFVPGAVPGDAVLARITKLDKRFGYGEVMRLEESSPDRHQDGSCSRYGECGGCELQVLAYEKQLEIKQNHLGQVLKRIGGVDLTNLIPARIVPSVDRCYYRSKIEFTFGEKAGQTAVGLSGKMSPFRPPGGHVVHIDDCRLFSPVAEKILPFARRFATESNLGAYDEATGKGLLRRLVLREAKSTGEVMVNIIAAGDISKYLGDFARDLTAAVPDVRSIYATHGDRPKLLYGKPYINELLAGLTLRIYPLSFFQPNPKTAEELYRRIVPLAALRGSETLVGLYSGAGTLELFLASSVGEVTGIDSSGESITCARENARINKISNAIFLRDKVERALAQFRHRKTDVALIDPPRAGMSKEALGAVRALKAEKLVYISCNPSTLARDLKMLRPGYLPRKIIPFDFFPHTGHFEVLTLLERQ